MDIINTQRWKILPMVSNKDQERCHTYKIRRRRCKSDPNKKTPDDAFVVKTCIEYGKYCFQVYY